MKSLFSNFSNPTEAHLQALIENAPFHIYSVDKNYCLTAANQLWLDTYEKTFGKRPDLGTHLPSFSPEPIGAIFAQRYEKTLKGEYLKLEQELGESEQKSYFEVTFSPIYVSGGIEGVLVIARDITENKLAALKIEASEKKYRALMDGAIDPIFLADPHTGMLIDANQKALDMVKRSKDELIQMHQTDLHPVQFRQEYEERFKKFAATQRIAGGTFQVIDKEGKEYPVDISQSLIEVNGQQIIQGVFRDMTEKIRATQEIERLKNFYENILNNAPIDIAVLDENNIYQFLNPKAVSDEVLRAWLTNKGVNDYYLYRNLDLSKGAAKINKLNQARETREPLKWEENLIDRTGRNIYILRRITPIFDESGKFLMNILTGEHITYLKNAQFELSKSEEKFRSLIESTNDWVWETNRRHYTYANPQVKNILGYDPEELVGKSPLRFMPESEALRLGIIFNALWEKGESFSLMEDTYWHKDGREVFIQTNGTPVFDESGKLIAFRGVARDITRRKRNQEALDKLLQELKDRNFELDSFVYKVSHDLRAPISSMMGLIALMQDENNPEQLHKYIDLAEDRVNRLDEFVQTILSYARNINQQSEPEIIDFEQIILRCFEEIQYMPHADRVELQIAQLGRSVFYGDVFRMMTIFKNFISNAVKYQNLQTERTIVKVSIDSQPNAALIRIQDNGLGIDAAHLPHIFEMFYRATHRAEGTGLGLYIVKQTLDKLGGTIDIKSELHQGTEILITLPNIRK